MARAEVYVVGHDSCAPQELKERGLNSNEARSVLRTRLEQQIPSCFGEFVLKSEFKEFFYEEVVNPQTGQKELQAPGFLGPIAKSYDKAIGECRRWGQSGRREIAECEGFRKLEKALFEAPEGTFYLWISPPGTKKEGYGDYSFTHLGQIKKTERGRRIEVTAWRNTLTLEEHLQIINYFLPEEDKLESPEDTDFLRNPILIEAKNDQTIDDLLVVMEVILRQVSNRPSCFAENYKQRKDWEAKLRQALKPMIDDYCSLLEQEASDAQLQQMFWVMENYTQDLINKSWVTIINEGPIPIYERKRTLFYQQYRYEPEALAGGNCPPDPSSLSKNFLSSSFLPWQQHRLENFNSQEGERKLNCTCPNCHQKIEAVIENGKIYCPACGASAEYKC